jgi:polar amino acid transport system substrate-binding protein
MLWTTTQQFHPWPFEKEIDLESAIAEIQHDLFARSRVYLEVKKLIGQFGRTQNIACGAARKAKKGGGWAGIRAIIVVVALAAVLAQAPQAPAQTPGPPEARGELVIGTKVAPPFAMKAEDGTWRGISIDLWRRIANQTHLRYRFQETTLKGLTDGVAEGSLDAAVAALTVTGPRQRVVDFTQPFYSTGLGIAVASDGGIIWWQIIRNVFSLGFIRAAAVLFAISLSVGVVLWLIEHRHNEHFGAHQRGLGASVWWSAAAMTQAGGAAGEKVPMTLPGRLLAMAWMVTSVIVFASFTAALTSQLTLKHLRGTVNGEADLRYVRVGAVAGTETTEYLSHERIAYQVLADTEAGLTALQKGRIDALVYDRPLLLWLVNERFSGSLRVLDGTFDPQVYAIALPQGSELRMPINLALLDAIRSDWWRETLFAYLGPS